MKKLTNLLTFVFVVLLGGASVVSCDPCKDVVCTNGDCSNGTCICIDGYERDHNKCIAYNEMTAGTYDGTQLMRDTSTTPVTETTTNMTYDVEAGTTSPYVLTLKTFNNIANNDIVFNLSVSNSDVIESQTVGNYTISGARTSTKLTLTISAPPKTWTLDLTKQ